MAHHQLRFHQPRPYFAELPYYLWGDANYDSDGDCSCPTDREWTWLRLVHRDTGAEVDIGQMDEAWIVEGTEPDASRAVHFLELQCGATPFSSNPAKDTGDWNHEAAEAWARGVREVFDREELEPFDDHLFWGSWKRIGWEATEFTWVGRWIMHGLLVNDVRAVPLIMEWLTQGTVDEKQSVALRYALERLTGKEMGSDQEWLAWYAEEGQEEYPEVDLDEWLEDFKSELEDA